MELDLLGASGALVEEEEEEEEEEEGLRAETRDRFDHNSEMLQVSLDVVVE